MNERPGPFWATEGASIPFHGQPAFVADLPLCLIDQSGLSLPCHPHFLSPCCSSLRADSAIPPPPPKSFLRTSSTATTKPASTITNKSGCLTAWRRVRVEDQPTPTLQRQPAPSHSTPPPPLIVFPYIAYVGKGSTCST